MFIDECLYRIVLSIRYSIKDWIYFSMLNDRIVYEIMLIAQLIHWSFQHCPRRKKNPTLMTSSFRCHILFLGTQSCQRTIEMVIIKMIFVWVYTHIDILLLLFFLLDNKISYIIHHFEIYNFIPWFCFVSFFFSMTDDDTPTTTGNRRQRVQWWIEIIGFW